MSKHPEDLEWQSHEDYMNDPENSTDDKIYQIPPIDIVADSGLTRLEHLHNRVAERKAALLYWQRLETEEVIRLATWADQATIATLAQHLHPTEAPLSAQVYESNFETPPTNEEQT